MAISSNRLNKNNSSNRLGEFVPTIREIGAASAPVSYNEVYLKFGSQLTGLQTLEAGTTYLQHFATKTGDVGKTLYEKQTNTIFTADKVREYGGTLILIREGQIPDYISKSNTNEFSDISSVTNLPSATGDVKYISVATSIKHGIIIVRSDGLVTKSTFTELPITKWTHEFFESAKELGVEFIGAEYFENSERLYLFTNTGAIFMSYDFETWEQVVTDLNPQGFEASTASESLLVFVDSQGSVFKTSDGFEWSKQENLTINISSFEVKSNCLNYGSGRWIINDDFDTLNGWSFDAKLENPVRFTLPESDKRDSLKRCFVSLGNNVWLHLGVTLTATASYTMMHFSNDGGITWGNAIVGDQITSYLRMVAYNVGRKTFVFMRSNFYVTFTQYAVGADPASSPLTYETFSERGFHSLMERIR